jgi:hypothetical protein
MKMEMKNTFAGMHIKEDIKAKGMSLLSPITERAKAHNAPIIPA